MLQPAESQKRPPFYALASVAVLLALLYFAREVLIPLALAVFFAFLLAPLVARLERVRLARLRLGRVASTLIVVLVALALVGAFGWVVERRLVQIVDELPRYREGVRTKFQKLTRSGGMVEKVREEIKQTVRDVPAPEAAATRPSTLPAAGSETGPGEMIRPPPTGTPAPDADAPPLPPLPRPTPDDPWPVRLYPKPTSSLEVAGEYLGRFLGPLATAGLVIVFVVFMLLGREDLRDRVIRLVGGGRLHVTTRAIDDAATRVSRFLVALSLINAAYGVLVALSLWTIDLTLGGGRGGILTALVAGMVCAVLRFVPYVGPWLGAALPLGLAFAAYPGNGVFFATLAMFVVVELAVSQAVEPKLLGSSTGVSPMAVLVAAVFWTWLWGPIGLLLSMPLTVILAVMGKYVPQLEFLAILLGDKPALEPGERIYQRLIAGDDEEAMDLARGYLKEMPLEAVYDRILIPALAGAEVDWHRGTLDDARHESVRRGFKRIVEALGDRQRALDTAAATARTVREARGTDGQAPQPPPATGGGPRPSLPHVAAVNVLCLPAQDEADEIVGLMLAQLLERRGYRVTSPGAAVLASEMVDLIDRHEAGVVVVSALPPRAEVHARYLVKRLSARHPELKVVVGLWTSTRESDKGRPGDFGAAQPVGTLAEAQGQLDQLTPQVLTDAAGLPAEAANQR